MNGRRFARASFFDDTSHSELTPPESPQRTATGFIHPDEVVADPRLSPAEQREILASWASDARSVPDAPALRRLDNDAVVRIEDVLRALNSLSEIEASAQRAVNPFWSYADRRTALSRRLKSPLRWGRPDDDDDPPPCPAMVAKPPSGPLSGEGAVDLGLAPAA